MMGGTGEEGRTERGRSGKEGEGDDEAAARATLSRRLRGELSSGQVSLSSVPHAAGSPSHFPLPLALPLPFPLPDAGGGGGGG